MGCRFTTKREVFSDWQSEHGWLLCLEWGVFKYSDGFEETGYRFIYRRPQGNRQTRGQARIPSLADATALMRKAEEAGWGHFVDGQEGSRIICAPGDSGD